MPRSSFQQPNHITVSLIYRKKLWPKFAHVWIIHLPPFFFRGEVLLRIIIKCISVPIIMMRWRIVSSLIKRRPFVPSPIFVITPLGCFGIKSLTVSWQRMMISVIVVRRRSLVIVVVKGSVMVLIPPLVLSRIHSITTTNTAMMPRRSVIITRFFLREHSPLAPHFFIAGYMFKTMVVLKGTPSSPPLSSGIRVVIIGFANLKVTIVPRLIIMFVFVPHPFLWMMLTILRHFYNPVVIDVGGISSPAKLRFFLRHDDRPSDTLSINVNSVFEHLLVLLPLENVEGGINSGEVPVCRLPFVRGSIGSHQDIGMVDFHHSFVGSSNVIEAVSWVTA
mmetsp:Transcript_10208/g.21521  ORF Transcript_10208/g.21521 Transcript_10208/m.21521 type:complete len:334 (+) Transcript_10208:269-1270(+)